MVAIIGLNDRQIRSAVRQMYGEVARSPSRRFHFPTGREACRFVGYPDHYLDMVPAGVLESFAGVGFPFRAGVIQAGDHVLDIGAGSGTDTFIAARLVGPHGHVTALDMTPEMVGKLRRNIALKDIEHESGTDPGDEAEVAASTEPPSESMQGDAGRQAGATCNIKVLEGMVESLPLADASVDVVTTNGVLNLVPDKRKAFTEIHRVLRPGGHVQLADVAIRRPVSDSSRRDPELWAECVVGAVVEEDYLDQLRACGFADIRLLRRFDYFSASSSPETRILAQRLGARSIELALRKPAHDLLATRLQRLHPAVLFRRAVQHGSLGLAATAAALLVCYGLLALVSILALTGLTLSIPSGPWAGAIVLLSALVPAALAWNIRAHRHPGPLLLGSIGALAVIYTLISAYDWRIEAAGFTMMLIAALWDRHLFRYIC